MAFSPDQIAEVQRITRAMFHEADPLIQTAIGVAITAVTTEAQQASTRMEAAAATVTTTKNAAQNQP